MNKHWKEAIRQIDGDREYKVDRYFKAKVTRTFNQAKKILEREDLDDQIQKVKSQIVLWQKRGCIPEANALKTRLEYLENERNSI